MLDKEEIENQKKPYKDIIGHNSNIGYHVSLENYDKLFSRNKFNEEIIEGLLTKLSLFERLIADAFLLYGDPSKKKKHCLGFDEILKDKSETIDLKKRKE